MRCRIVAGADMPRFEVVRIEQEVTGRDGVWTFVAGRCPIGYIREAIGFLPEAVLAGEIIHDGDESGGAGISLIKVSSVDARPPEAWPVLPMGRSPLREAYAAWRAEQEAKRCGS